MTTFPLFYFLAICLYIYLCVCVFAPRCVFGGQKTIWGSWMSPSTMWGSQNRTPVVRFGGRHLCPLNHPSNPMIIFETGPQTTYISEDNLELPILPPSPAECRDYRRAAPQLILCGTWFGTQRSELHHEIVLKSLSQIYSYVCSHVCKDLRSSIVLIFLL